MKPSAPLPVVRVRVSCADAQEYRRVRAPEFAARGVHVRSDRLRPVGARVRLRIELLDGSFGHDGEAIVARHVVTGSRPGYVLRWVPPANPRDEALPSREVGATQVSPDLASLLFSDLDLPAPGAEPVALAPPPPPAPTLTPPPTPTPRPLPRLTPPPRLAVLAPRRPPALDEPDVAAAGPRGAPTLEEGARSATPPPLLAFDPGELPEPTLAATRTLTAQLGRIRSLIRRKPLAAVVLAGAVVAVGTVLVAGPTRAEAHAADFAAELRRADDRLRTGRLSGNDSALDHLVAARELVRDDPRLAQRTKLLADLFGDLGERALARGDLEEATAHFQATLRADPGRERARQRLRELTGRALPALAARGAGARGAPARP